MDVIRLAPAQKKQAARVFKRSFFDYPMITAYWPEVKRRERHLEWYLGCAVTYGLRYGEVYTTPDVAGIAIWLPQGQTSVTTWRYIVAGYLPLPIFMGYKQMQTVAMRGDDLVHEVHEKIMPAPHWYLWALAVDPDRQGKGIGAALLEPGLEKAEAQHLPCYVETHDMQNLPFYTKQGFALVHTEKVPDSDLHFWCMVRNSGRAPDENSGEADR